MTATTTPRSTASLRPALVLSLWTLFVWTLRIRNIWTDDALATGEQVWRTAMSVVFTVFALAVLVVWSTRRRGGTFADDRDVARIVRSFAVWTVAVWAIRGVQIAVADHSGAFIAVHTVLAVVSIALAVWADRSLA